ncbi:glycosyltransferase 87 family protein [Arsenicibacter rosenii]|uniref:DUF2029 domain-containing protein n=1 Tax=Arsenicibacter rosenii TaxID=1750698 RepID=A0A1S2VQU9_9BACT|nr:glycosyltransferase 87 family protein [Arsenicibacter rosenii]OIN60168.1 hypothetical protein BLX24_04825 [Arsenicibacter rosenii]
MTITPFRVGWLILSACLYALVGYNTPRGQFPMLAGFALFLFWGYLLRIRTLTDDTRPDRFLFMAAILFRLLLLLAPPQLSDDYFRFIWDGRLVAQGFNPYLYLPGTIVNAVSGLDEVLLQLLNSPNYYTVYPPLNQLLFGLAATLSPGSIEGSVFWLRIPVLLAETGCLWLMVQLLKETGKNPNLALLYGLNPLVILELTGNLHYEGVMVFFVLLAGWLLIRGRLVLAGGAMGLAIATKLLPLILLPLAIRWLGWRRGMLFSVISLGVMLLLFIPFFSLELVQNLFSSLNLYFQKFEFNASVYYLFRWLGFRLLGYNAVALIGPMLSITTFAGILWLSWRNEANQPALLMRLAGILTLYFLMATTVHPWYLTTLVAAAVFVPVRYPLMWSGLVILSYATYQTMPYHENLWFTAFEYSALLLFAVREWQQKTVPPDA